ncbi:hypothetical protein [Achromobacter spanius]|uniref:hypothetical protein n=1 Tax=Achromobacter spanius TaxID=217203 RepID=UPI0038075539
MTIRGDEEKVPLLNSRQFLGRRVTGIASAVEISCFILKEAGVNPTATAERWLQERTKRRMKGDSEPLEKQNFGDESPEQSNGAPGAIELAPAFAFKEFLSRWVTPKFNEAVLEPLVAEYSYAYQEAVRVGNQAEQRRIKLCAYLWICHALIKGFVPAVLGMFIRRRTPPE